MISMNFHIYRIYIGIKVDCKLNDNLTTAKVKHLFLKKQHEFHFFTFFLIINDDWCVSGTGVSCFRASAADAFVRLMQVKALSFKKNRYFCIW